MREINRTSSTVTAQSCHRTMVAFKHLSDACFAVIIQQIAANYNTHP